VLRLDGGTNSARISPFMYSAEASATPGVMRQCPLCHELMDMEDWRRVPRHETVGTFGKTIKLTCPKCHQQSNSTQWQELRARSGLAL
jgi:RNA polymerase subunit RPABC4/transcription elongation factor Spt4